VLAGEIELGIALLSNVAQPQRFARHTATDCRRSLAANDKQDPTRRQAWSLSF